VTTVDGPRMAPEVFRVLLREYETMQNVALCAYALGSFASGFEEDVASRERGLTLWHLFSMLPLVLHEIPRKVITKRRVASGLRSILSRDSELKVRENEVIFNLPGSMRDMRQRSMRALNCAIAWDLLAIADGVFVSSPRFRLPKRVDGETREILEAARKLGIWAGRFSTFEYLTVLGIDPVQ
jgi:hypothetical protein